MKKYFMIALIVLISSFAGAQVVTSNHQETLFIVHFEDDFRQDTIRVEINNCLVKARKIVSSDKAIEVPSYIIEGFKRDRSQMIIAGDNTYDCTYKHKPEFLITYNQKIFKFSINLKRGKYIGFYKDYNQVIQVVQSKKPFTYM